MQDKITMELVEETCLICGQKVMGQDVHNRCWTQNQLDYQRGTSERFEKQLKLIEDQTFLVGQLLQALLGRI